MQGDLKNFTPLEKATVSPIRDKSLDEGRGRSSLTGFTHDNLKKYLLDKELPSYYADQIFNWVYKKRVEDFNLMTDISKESRVVLRKDFYFSKLELLKKEVSKDATIKALFKLADEARIETVLIPESNRNTLCVSTQAGCKFQCKFCLSGRYGFKRNLTISEIVNQYLSVSDLISPDKITNIVFMGIGEPLDNFSNTIGAVKIFLHNKGICLGKRRICISTSGVVPKIEELTRLKLGVKLSISLHSADNHTRSTMMPINKKYPLESLMRAAKRFAKEEKRPITFEYVLISGLNVKKEDVIKLEKILRGINYKLNVIPCNQASLNYRAPYGEEIDSFISELKKRKMFFTLRKPRGQDISAACGQLTAMAE